MKVNSQIIRKAEYGEHAEEIRNKYKLLVWRPDGSRILWRPNINKWTTLKYTFKRQIMKNGLKD